LTKNLYEFEKYSLRRILADFFEDRHQKTGHTTKKIRKQQAPTKGIKTAD